mgnify:CR=1 FL=1
MALAIFRTRAGVSKEAIRAELYYEGLGPDQLRSNRPVWYDPNADIAWVPQPAAFDFATIADLWQEQPGQERSIAPVWFQPDTEAWVPIPGLGSAQPELVAPPLAEQPGRQRLDVVIQHEHQPPGLSAAGASSRAGSRFSSSVFP